MSNITKEFKKYKVGTMVASTEGIGKVIHVEMISTGLGTKDPLHSIQLNGSHRIYRTVNDLEPARCTEDHRWDPYMKWCVECTAEELGHEVHTSMPEIQS